MQLTEQQIIRDFENFLQQKDFPCIAAKAALARQQIFSMVTGHMACPKDDAAILQFLYNFVDISRNANDIFYSAAIIFKEPVIITEKLFDHYLWQRLQALHNLDAKQYAYDNRVSDDTASAQFSFSLKEEAFFIIGLHPQSSRSARQFQYPVLVFNPHQQFVQLRQANRYENMKRVVRQRDQKFSGTINPMLTDFGEAPEVYQYSGKQYDGNWKCPLTIQHDNNINRHSSP